MILLADSGATKADWVALDNNGVRILTLQTQGLSPEVIDKKEILKRLNENFELLQNKDKITKIFFYGAGCGSDKMKEIIYSALNVFFTQAKEIIVEEDTYGATYATTPIGTKAIVCILGTGSNCCYYDGNILHQKIKSLGYLLMDDCSGNKLGGELLRAYNLKILPSELSYKLEQEYNLDIDEIKAHLYKSSSPNTYLATFAKFVIQNKNHEYIQQMINRQIQTFIDFYIKQYDNCAEVPINVNGSIGFYLKEELENKLYKNGLKLGTILRRPIEGLVDYISRYKL